MLLFCFRGTIPPFLGTKFIPVLKQLQTTKISGYFSLFGTADGCVSVCVCGGGGGGRGAERERERERERESDFDA